MWRTVLLLCVCAACASGTAGARVSKRFVVGGCPGHCDAGSCPAMPRLCSTGQVLDQCGCCPVCASGEGEACGGVGKLGDPVCADGLECSVGGGAVGYTATVRRRGQSGVCVCRSGDREPVCGSDGQTYRSACELRRATERAQRLQQPPVLLIQRGACGTDSVVPFSNQTNPKDHKPQCAPESAPLVDSIVWQRDDEYNTVTHTAPEKIKKPLKNYDFL